MKSPGRMNDRLHAGRQRNVNFAGDMAIITLYARQAKKTLQKIR